MKTQKTNSLLLIIGVLAFINFNVDAQVSNVSESNGIVFLNKNSASDVSGLKRGGYVGPHILGDTVTILMNVFESKYTYYVAGSGAYASDIKKVLKPNIYKSIKSINKFYEKGVKKNKIEDDVAKARMKDVLDIAIKLYGYETSALEGKLKDLKSANQKEAYLKKIVFNSK
jgi:hypothetical protein